VLRVEERESADRLAAPEMGVCVNGEQAKNTSSLEKRGKC
jgi:hypothetical protein